MRYVSLLSGPDGPIVATSQIGDDGTVSFTIPDDLPNATYWLSDEFGEGAT
jgi:hypothetical protein